MGQACSSESSVATSAPTGANGKPTQPEANAALVHPSRASFANVDLAAQVAAVTKQLHTEVHARRAASGGNAAAAASLRETRGAEGIIARGAMMAIYSTPADIYEAFLAAEPQYADMPTVTCGTSNAMAGRMMMAMSMELQQAIEAAAQGQPANVSLSGERLLGVIKFKAIWGPEILGVTLVQVDHGGAMGKVALCQPLLHTACMTRAFNGQQAGATDEVFDVLLQRDKGGADPNVRNSVGMTPLMMVAVMLLDRLRMQASSSSSDSAGLRNATSAATSAARKLLAHGADPQIVMYGYGTRGTAQNFALWANRLDLMRHVLHLERYTVLDAYNLIAKQLQAEVEWSAELAACIEQFGALLSSPGAAAAEAPCAPRRLGRSVRNWPWMQAMGNVAWAVQQLEMASDTRVRRARLQELQHHAPFVIPPMAVVSVQQLRELGHIPRYAATLDGEDASAAAVSGGGDAPFRPIFVDELPASAVVVFVSHRWLGNGCPDDAQGTKIKQVFAIASHVAAMRGVALELVHLWLDYSVVNQADPMPGVQMLPVYMACCDEFVYVAHPQYWERAWCLTEQYMNWRLSTSDAKHCLQGEHVRTESAREQPPDPTYGKLAVEADRVALMTMTSMFPYNPCS